jgi:hypothetical protein
MEWFYGPKGLRFFGDRIAVRRGVRAWDLYDAANDSELYHEWAMASCHRTSDRPLAAVLAGYHRAPARAGRQDHRVRR